MTELEKLTNSTKTGNFTGYIWLENKNKPTIIKSSSIINWETCLKSSLFVMEAMLCNTEKSISIKAIDGKHFIQETILNTLDSNEEEIIKVPIAKSDNYILKLIPFFENRPDPFSEGFEEAYFSHYIFLGFTKN